LHDKPSTRSAPKIIAGGLFSPLTRQYEATRKRLLSAARLRHVEELKSGSLLKRIRIKLAIEREVQTELEKIFPPSALYVVAQKY
jgi:hypothetical protein